MTTPKNLDQSMHLYEGGPTGFAIAVNETRQLIQATFELNKIERLAGITALILAAREAYPIPEFKKFPQFVQECMELEPHLKILINAHKEAMNVGEPVMTKTDPTHH